MQFNNLQLSAILKIELCMAYADGKIEDSELTVVTIGMTEFGVDQNHFAFLNALADAMTPSTMLATLSSLDENQKKFVCGFLASIMTCDGEIDASELKLWQMTSSLAGFPIMTISEAKEYWVNN